MILLISILGTCVGILFSAVLFIVGVFMDLVIWIYRVLYTIREVFR